MTSASAVIIIVIIIADRPASQASRSDIKGSHEESDLERPCWRDLARHDSRVGLGQMSPDLPRLGAGAAGAGMGYTMGTGTTFGSGCSITFSLSLSYACVFAPGHHELHVSPVAWCRTGLKRSEAKGRAHLLWQAARVPRWVRIHLAEPAAWLGCSEEAPCYGKFQG